MEDLAHVDARLEKLGARRRDVVDDEERPLNGARRGGRDPPTFAVLVAGAIFPLRICVLFIVASMGSL